MKNDPKPQRFIALVLLALVALAVATHVPILPVVEAQSPTTLDLSDCTSSALQTEWSAMSSGAYILVFPACSGTSWTSGISLTMPTAVTSVTVEGQSTVTCVGTPGQSNYSYTATDNTILIDAISPNDDPLVAFTINGASQAFRLTGMTFEGGSTTTSHPNGFLTISGSTQNLRVDHNNFNSTTYTPLGDAGADGGLTTTGSLNGVFDHNTFELYDEGNGVRVFYWGDSYGDLSFSQPSQWGSSNFIFVESNDFNGVGAADDCDEGGRIVVRYNTIEPNDTGGNDAGLVQGHQMGQGQQRDRGCREMEVYDNHFYDPYAPSNPMYSSTETGSATALIWGNSVNGYNYGTVMENIREIATGHTQTAWPTGIGYCGNASNGSTMPLDGNSVAATGYPCLDQTGRGQSDLLTGNFPSVVDSATGTAIWPNQLLEPWYIWNQTLGSGVQGYNNPNYNGVQMTANRDFYYQAGTSANTSPTSPFNGSSGTGWGTLANRPTSCTAGAGGTFGKSPTGSYGVAYFATDQNTLYVCTAANVWTAIYTPYIYPHPLVSGGGGGGGGGSTLNPPTISPANGGYASPQTVTMGGPSGATVCYRTDGNAPTAATAGTCDAGSTTYSGPFSLAIPSTGVVVEAIATESGETNSSVTTASYTLQTCLNTPLGGNWTCVADASNTGAGAASVTAGPMAANPPAGSLVVVFQWQEGNNICVAPTDTLGTTFTGVSSATVSAISMYMCDWYGVVGAGGAQESVTCNAGSTQTAIACMAVDVTGQSSGAIVDQACTRSNGLSASGINNMTCANSITVETPNELAVAAAFGDYGVRSAGASFTMIDASNWSGEYFMEATPMIWTPTETINASGLNYGFLAVTLEPYSLVQTLRAPTGVRATVQ